MTERNTPESGSGGRNPAESGYVVIDESHDVPETSSTERQHVLDRSCWCRPLVDGNAVKHRRP